MRNRNLLIGGLIALILGVAGMAFGPGDGGGWGTWDHGSMMGDRGMMWGWDDDTSSAPISGAPTSDVAAIDFGFDPVRVEVEAGEAFNLRLVNEGSLLHDLTIRELDVRIVANPGRTAVVGIEGPAPGEYSFECSLPGHASAGMVGVLVVNG